ncbi:EDD domain protein, partial [Streptococcus dysgalactiae]
MKLAVITDSTATLPIDLKQDKAIFSLDIPVIIDDETYFEGRNLSIDDFYQKMADSKNLPKTSQPSLSELD